MENLVFYLLNYFRLFLFERTELPSTVWDKIWLILDSLPHRICRSRADGHYHEWSKPFVVVNVWEINPLHDSKAKGASRPTRLRTGLLLVPSPRGNPCLIHQSSRSPSWQASISSPSWQPSRAFLPHSRDWWRNPRAFLPHDRCIPQAAKHLEPYCQAVSSAAGPSAITMVSRRGADAMLKRTNPSRITIM